MSKSNVYILGNFGYFTGQLDGQTMESRSLLQLLRLKNIKDIDFFDTEQLHYQRSSIFQLFYKLLKTKRLFYLGAQGSLKYLFPFVWACCKLLGIEFHYFIVGGWIAEFIRNLPLHRLMLRKVDCLYCETKSIVKKLRDWYGYEHAVWFPNFRIYEFEPSIVEKQDGPLRLVFMSRIIKHKGYPRIFNLANRIQKAAIENIEIDFYGPMYDSDREPFLDGVNKYSFVSYKGVLQPQDINPTLATYDVMLFPTSYPGEGLPGTILDSYISGIPVIASDWRYNSELIDHEVSGYLFSLEKEQELFDYVLKLYNDRALLYQLKQGAYLKSKAFDMETVWQIIKKHSRFLT